MLVIWLIIYQHNRAVLFEGSGFVVSLYLIIFILLLFSQSLASHLVQSAHRVCVDWVLVLDGRPQQSETYNCCVRGGLPILFYQYVTLDSSPFRYIELYYRWQKTYLNHSQVAVLGVCAEVKDIPLHVNGGWGGKRGGMFHCHVINKPVTIVQTWP